MSRGGLATPGTTIASMMPTIRLVAQAASLSVEDPPMNPYAAAAATTALNIRANGPGMVNRCSAKSRNSNATWAVRTVGTTDVGSMSTKPQNVS